MPHYHTSWSDFCWFEHDRNNSLSYFVIRLQLLWAWSKQFIIILVIRLQLLWSWSKQLSVNWRPNQSVYHHKRNACVNVIVGEAMVAHLAQLHLFVAIFFHEYARQVFTGPWHWPEPDVSHHGWYFRGCFELFCINAHGVRCHIQCCAWITITINYWNHDHYHCYAIIVMITIIMLLRSLYICIFYANYYD